MPHPSKQSHIVGQALVDKHLNILAYSGQFHRWALSDSHDLINQPLLKLLPELIGLESDIEKLFQQELTSLNVPKIHRSLSPKTDSYFDLSLESALMSNNTLLATIVDVTKETDLMREIIQERNDLRLEVKARERAEKSLQDLNETLEEEIT
ncbi:MAG: hypothetical protein AAF485_11875, partial [Chloroflexota bacterium]